jgi:putative DNA-invertase from lambdoid prophage Rac
MAMATYGYARVSTIRQADDGESLPVQERTIGGYAMMHGLTVDRVFVERGVSGSKPLRERPQGKALIDTLRPGDVVITPKLDRMFRSALDALDVLAKLKECGISLHMIDLGEDVTGNGISKLVFTILSAVAEAERDRIRERVATVKADQRGRGRYLGGTRPFGMRIGEDGALEPVPEEQAAIDHIRRLRASGASLRTIASELQAIGHQLSHVAVQAILAREESGAKNLTTPPPPCSREAPLKPHPPPNLLSSS